MAAFMEKFFASTVKWYTSPFMCDSATIKVLSMQPCSSVSTYLNLKVSRFVTPHIHDLVTNLMCSETGWPERKGRIPS